MQIVWMHEIKDHALLLPGLVTNKRHCGHSHVNGKSIIFGHKVSEFMSFTGGSVTSDLNIYQMLNIYF